ncbi:hypothetical protein [Actinacidiphila sp. ITFR-21]|uniref:hypothetical protein n=1 Tax=Actinacidiphila sp. ITFR-21 TaxID=3075199 RepID=UPI00288A6ADF|nr:hypothetical protein [Streptomyces sp. ITFR-21]WNI15024.1 hypothetical protein RLT57_05405 [Streptomyces sp. ITFR-21]
MADTSESTPEDRPGSRADARAERRAARLAKQIGAFARSHGGAEAGIAYIGRRGARIVLVAEDGAWGDLVAPTYALAQAATARAGVTVHDELGGDFAARMRTGRYEWSRMAGIQVGGPANT